MNDEIVFKVNVINYGLVLLSLSFLPYQYLIRNIEMFLSNQESSWEQRNEEEAVTDLPNTSFSAIEETRLSDEDDETEESLVTTQKDNEAQMELEESPEPTQKEDDAQMVSEPSEPIQQTQTEPEKEEPIQ